MSLEAWGDEGAGIGPRDWARVEERAAEKAAENPELGFPDGADLDQVQLEEIPTDEWGWAFRATYEGRSVEVFVSGSILEPDDEP